MFLLLLLSLIHMLFLPSVALLQKQLTPCIIENEGFASLNDLLALENDMDVTKMAKHLVGHTVADIPAIVHSIDPCMSCTERITYIKKEGS